jgi:hypothetical protein
MKKEDLMKDLMGKGLTRQQASDEIDELMGKKKRTPLQLEIDEINLCKRKHPELKSVSTQLISNLKSEVEKRGIVPAAELNKLRKAFGAMLAVYEEGDEAPVTEEEGEEGQDDPEGN